MNQPITILRLSMPKFSTKSLKQLETCAVSLQTIAHGAIKVYDFSVLQGYRGQKEQDEAFKRGASKLKFPFSRHNKYPSHAMDLVPYPIDWEDLNRFFELSGVIKTIAYQNNIRIKWGAEWATLKDYPHWELVED